jgi:hypothetical protein
MSRRVVYAHLYGAPIKDGAPTALLAMGLPAPRLQMLPLAEDFCDLGRLDLGEVEEP